MGPQQSLWIQWVFDAEQPLHSTCLFGRSKPMYSFLLMRIRKNHRQDPENPPHRKVPPQLSLK